MTTENQAPEGAPTLPPLPDNPDADGWTNGQADAIEAWGRAAIAAQPNLACPSVQARLAAQWGYAKPASAEGALTDEDRTRALNLAYQFRSHPASRSIDDIEQAGELILSLLAQPVMPNGLTEAETSETASANGLTGDPGTSINDGARIFARVMEYCGKTRREVHNPCLTARECIALANYIAASDRAALTSKVQPKGTCGYCYGTGKAEDTDQGLIACPFCGRRPVLTVRPENAEATSYFAAVACFCDGYAACAHKDATAAKADEAERLARERWNNRAAPSPEPSPKRVSSEQVASGEVVRWLLEYTFNGDEKGSAVYESEAECRRSVERDGGVCVPLVRAAAQAPAVHDGKEQP